MGGLVMRRRRLIWRRVILLYRVTDIVGKAVITHIPSFLLKFLATSKHYGDG